MLVIQRPTVEPIGEEETNRQRFAVGPLEPGFGHTIGNSLRRTLLSSIPGAAITTVRFDEALHEFDTIQGVTEDATDIILNLKDVVLTSESDEPVYSGSTCAAQPIITAGDIRCPADVEILNKDLHIATLNAKGRLAIDLTVERGRGYLSCDRETQNRTIGVIPIDAIFSPIRRANFEVEPTRVEQSTNFDRLIVDIETDGSITPAMRWLRPVRRCGPWSTSSPVCRRSLRASSSAKSSGGNVTSPDLDLPIEDLDLSERPRNCLKRAQINSIGELLAQDRGRPAEHHQLRAEVAR